MYPEMSTSLLERLLATAQPAGNTDYTLILIDAECRLYVEHASAIGPIEAALEAQRRIALSLPACKNRDVTAQFVLQGLHRYARLPTAANKGPSEVPSAEIITALSSTSEEENEYSVLTLDDEGVTWLVRQAAPNAYLAGIMAAARVQDGIDPDKNVDVEPQLVIFGQPPSLSIGALMDASSRIDLTLLWSRP